MSPRRGCFFPSAPYLITAWDAPHPSVRDRDSGGDSTGVPPLPIPNREVKPRRADGTAKAGE